MEKTLTNDEFETKCWLYVIINDPYQVFAEAFSTAEMDFLRSFTKKILSCAESEEIYRQKSPCDALLFMRVIRSLVKAAYSLKEIKNGPIMVSEGDAFNKKYYSSNYPSPCDWGDFPRFLSVKEFCNPYKVFGKFFKYKDCESWVHDLEEIVDAALSKNKGELGLEMITIYSHLAKLIEASNLINVREVTHVGGILKTRFINPDH